MGNRMNLYGYLHRHLKPLVKVGKLQALCVHVVPTYVLRIGSAEEDFEAGYLLLL